MEWTGLFLWAFKRIKRKLKGSWRDPFLYLELTSVVLFCLMISVTLFSNIESSNILATSSLIQKEFRSSNSFVVSDQNIPESPDLYLIQNNSLAAASPPITVTPQILGAIVGGVEWEDIQREVVEYIVEPGDNLWSIADRFNVSVNTIRWANDLNSDFLQVNQKLVILPITGVIHHVQKGDTISGISKTYKVETDEVVAFNGLSTKGDIFIGDILIVPGGIMPPKYSPATYAPLASSYFICPIGSPCRITQGLHWYNAVDMNNGCGKPIFAPASGRILKVRLTSSRSKWAFGGLGNHMTILHPNGVVTYYGHISTSLVSQDDWVSKGDVIAYVGGTPGTAGAGNSTACHLHFGVSGARNPFR
ncbi:MAG TPA: LysM peptidoglycan-binding domain-containing protein [Candidatus Parcubacteria bacterium]|jgi:LysM repeat protein|nr:LysM peptidoglycan-binding domain-containing protein [Candidatus Parcubacteria bacterium]|tara:strand:+ start:294 stop:1379 length:1086 start_codon:yes stop_codon:yes gene_type:complete